MTHRTLSLACLASVIGFLIASGFASAHAQYVTSSPAASQVLPSPPNNVSVTLSETIESGTGTIRVTNDTAVRFDNGTVTYSSDRRTMSVLLGPSGPGIYTVTWTAVSAVDGHFTAGSFSYGVQDANGNLNGTLAEPSNAGAPVSPFEVTLRSIGFFGLAVALGIGVLGNFMWLPAGRDPDAKGSRAYGLAFPVVLNVGRIAAFAFVASTAGLFALATGFEGTSVAEGLAASPYVQSVVVRIVLGVALFGILSKAFAQSRQGGPEKAAWTIQASLVLAVAAVVVGSIGTHAAAAPVLAALGVAADAAHLGSVGLWVGGLTGILAVRGFFREPEAAPLARIVLGRFSRMAAYAVGVLLAAGVVLALLLVGTIDALIGTAYGWVVLGKIALFAPMLGLGAFNRYRLIPQTAESDSPTTAVRRIVRNVRFETGLGVTVLILSGLLTSMTPAVGVTIGPTGIFALDATVDGIHVHFETFPYPTVSQPYTLTFLLNYASNGTEFRFSRNATIQYNLTGSPRPPVKEDLSGPHGNHYFITTTSLSETGVWRIVTDFQRLDSFDLRATFYVTLRAGG